MQMAAPAPKFALVILNERPLVAIFRGGWSGESVISHQSAERMMQALDQERYEGVFITIDGVKWTCEDARGSEIQLDRADLTLFRDGERQKISGALIAIHGSPGEDGRLQGYLDMLKVPYQTGDHICMGITFSKFSTTAVLRQLGFPVAPSVLLHRMSSPEMERITELGLPVFVKPDRSGSSLGVSKVSKHEDLKAALETAFKEGDQVMVEGAVKGHELTCGVLRIKGMARAMPVCEVRTSREFFDYEAKYHSSDTQEIIPAPLPDHITRMVQERSMAIYQAFNCRGMVRVDHFWTGGDDEASIITIELNTVPGFSGASIFPKMLDADGMGVSAAVNGLVAEMLGR
jgi:D-alanine-D-alanine ligase